MPRRPTASCATTAWKSASAIFWGCELIAHRHSGAARRAEPGISRFRVRRGACHRAAHCADPLASPRNDGGEFDCATGDRLVTQPCGRQGTGWEVAYAALVL